MALVSAKFYNKVGNNGGLTGAETRNYLWMLYVRCLHICYLILKLFLSVIQIV